MESNVYNHKLKAVSPIHIGSGKDYGPSEYVSGKAKLKGEVIKTLDRIDFGKYYMNLPENKQEKFLHHLSDSKFRLEDYDSKINKEYRRYRCIDKSNTQTNDILEHIKTSDMLYIPGSSLKGAIKTAIFYDRLTDEDIRKISNEIISPNRKGNGNIIKRWEYDQFIDKYFSSKKGNAAQKSIMRFIQVSDSSTLKIPTIHQVCAVMAKNRGGMPDGTQFYSRHGNVVKTFLETIDKNKAVKSSITINRDKTVIKRLDLSDKQDILDINYLKKVIYQFSADLIQYELDYADKYSVGYLTKFYKKLDKLNSLEKPLLRVGAGSGLMATSISMKVKDYDPWIFEEIRKTFRRSYPYEFPKSRKVTKTGQPLGWIQLIGD